ncbi:MULTISPECIES: pantetheine-phosphate adenylyltransferase [unclassified Enterococcus]|uniref:pantetheine-phosphate adenylyltransferase n=1 Tax=unclassified Enterococcus TaxID=2608891 RepID=UPI001C12DBDB|nr:MULTISPECIES: pantetheine-phosphate adenylyltransferase [unclassified Enterococcus]
MKKALYAGSFDILTNGHLDMIHRGVALFDQLYIGIFYNITKTGFFEIEERYQILENLTQELPNLKIIQSSGELTVDVAKRLDTQYLLRGIRNMSDYQYETEMARFNHEINPKIETVFLQSRPEFEHISSSRMKELIHFGGDISNYVPPLVVQKLEEKRIEKA